VFPAFLIYEHGGTRTPAPQDRNLMLYPLNHVPLLLDNYDSTLAKITPANLASKPHIDRD
jgi:hypothetical protein